MPLLAAARQGDPIAHTSLMGQICGAGAGLLVGAAVGFLAGVVAEVAIGAAVAALGVGTVLTGGLLGVVAVAVVSTVMVYGAGKAAHKMGLPDAGDIANRATNAIAGMFPPSNEGTIAESSPNVFINSKPAARAVSEGADNVVVCQKHTPMPMQFVAEGSATVFINGFPAHRKSERITCDGKTSDGSPNVFIGGDSQQTRDIDSSDPWWIKYAGIIIGIALAACSRDWKSFGKKIACLGVGVVAAGATELGLTAAFGKPVHAATGAKILDGSDDTDFALPARLPLVWTRRYSSLDQREGLLGLGWSVPVSVQLRVNQPGEHPNVFIDFQGREIPFDAIEAGQSQWNISEGWRLACTLGGSYVVEDDSGNYHEFGQAQSDQAHTLALQRIEDRNGNYIALRYDDHGKLHEMADCASRLYHCEYDTQHPTRLAAISVHVDDHSPVITVAHLTAIVFASKLPSHDLGGIERLFPRCRHTILHPRSR